MARPESCMDTNYRSRRRRAAGEECRSSILARSATPTRPPVGTRGSSGGAACAPPQEVSGGGWGSHRPDGDPPAESSHWRMALISPSNKRKLIFLRAPPGTEWEPHRPPRSASLQRGRAPFGAPHGYNTAALLAQAVPVTGEGELQTLATTGAEKGGAAAERARNGTPQRRRERGAGMARQRATRGRGDR